MNYFGNYRKFFAAFLAAAALFIFLQFDFSPGLPLHDFSLFWKAANNLIRGENPYQLPPYSSFNGNSFSEAPQYDNSIPSLSPPPSLGMFAFIGGLDLDKAKSAYLCIFCMAFFRSSWIGFSWFLNKHKIAKTGDLLLAILVLPLAAYFQSLAWGSLTVIAVIGICGFFLASARGSYWIAGFCLALCGVKPQLFLLFIVYLIWWVVAKRKYPIIWGAASVYVIGALISICYQPKIFVMYFGALKDGIAYRVTNASLGSVLYYLCGQQNSIYLYLPIMLGALILAFMLRLRTAGNLVLFGSIILPFSLLLSPYCWGHDYIICFATFFSSANCIYASIKRNLYTRTVLLLTSFLGCILSMVLVSFSHKAVSFIAFGVGLAFLSALVLIFTEHELAELNRQ